MRGTWGRYSQRSSPIAGAAQCWPWGSALPRHGPFLTLTRRLAKRQMLEALVLSLCVLWQAVLRTWPRKRRRTRPVGDAGQGKAPRAAAWPETRWVPFSVPFSVVRSAFLGRGSSCTCSAAAHAYRCPTTSPAAPLRRENRPKVRIFWRPLCPEHLRVGCSRLSGGYSAGSFGSGTREAW